MRLEQELALQMTRRRFFGRGARGIGSLALASLLREDLYGDAAGRSYGALNRLHFAPTAKRVIYLFMSGAPSQLDLFDSKPKLVEMTGQPMPESVTRGQRIAQLAGRKLVCVGSRFQFGKHGRSGAEISELLPHTAGIADDLAIIRSMHTDAINHDPAVTLIQT